MKKIIGRLSQAIPWRRSTRRSVVDDRYANPHHRGTSSARTRLYNFTEKDAL